MTGAARLTDRQKARISFALEILERHAAAVDRAIAALKEVAEGAEYADWARQATHALEVEVGNDYREFVRQRLGLTVEEPEAATPAEAPLSAPISEGSQP